MARHDARVLLLALLAGAPGVAAALVLLAVGDHPPYVTWVVGPVIVVVWASVTIALRAHVVRPLQTLANMIAALREGRCRATR